MSDRTFAIGDIHGDLEALNTLLSRLPELDSKDTIVFLGDYIDSGPESAAVVELIRHELPKRLKAKIVVLRGNHEDAWLKVIDEGWPGFVMPPGNGTRETFRSYVGMPRDAEVGPKHYNTLFEGEFFPEDVVEWMRSLPYFYEDQHAIYVHAGLAYEDGRWLHPEETEDKQILLWQRKQEFFLEYDGKSVVCGHTGTNTLPQTADQYTPDDANDVYWAGRSVYAVDTLCGKGGFLSAIEFPSRQVYESR
ncbi:MAG: serine/threonine protein phosphatase [Proteobacteria bacterium]|nr:serine/threonine protein phosphatase [Pseudomonadota bacterium]